MRLVITRRIASVPGVRAVYLCHSLAMGECYPGLSDFDIAIVFDGRNPPEFYKRMRRAWGLLKRFFPISDLSVLTAAEFETWQRTGGGWDPLDEVRHWKLLAGEELRQRKFEASTDDAAMDRMQWALGHFQNLLGVVLKEEQKSPLMAIVARRQLHKCFWNCVLALDAKYLALSTHRARVEEWISDNGMPPVITALQEMYARRFTSGPVTSVRFDAAALAYRLLNESLSLNPLLARPLARPKHQSDAVPVSNHMEVEDRARALAQSLVEVAGENIESIMLDSTGSSRGYTLHVVLRDGLSQEALVTSLRDIRAVFRVFDDPWFNEHVPAGRPTVSSKVMFLARLQTGRASLHYVDKFRRVLHGNDLYAEAVSASHVDAVESPDPSRDELLYSLNLHQVYMAWLKPALHDFATFHFPRMFLQRERGIVPATAEEAVALYEGAQTDATRSIPREMLEAYHGKDLDGLIKQMTREVFDETWPLVSKGLLRAGTRA